MESIYINWQGDGFLAQDNSSGTQILFQGGEEKSISPPALLLKSLGGCAGIYFIHIAQKMRCQVKDLCIKVTGERREERPQIFKGIALHYRITASLPLDQVERILTLSHRYCPVLHSLNPAISIETTWEQVDDSKEG